MSTVYNICILGNKGCGKSAFLIKHTTGMFCKVHRPTVRNMCYNLEFKSEKENFDFNVYEHPDKDKIDSCDGFIICFDPSSPLKLSKYLDLMDDKPFVVCLLKWNQRVSKCISNGSIMVNSKHSFNLNMPFIKLLEKLGKEVKNLH